MRNKTKILLVEDEPNFGAVLKSYLQLANYEVDWCKNGKEAFSKFQNESYQLCILDIMMPEMDGFTLGKEIKTLYPELPFIYLSAKGMKTDILKGFKIGAEDYLTKPFDSDILLEKIKAVLRRTNSNDPSAIISEKIQIGDYTFYPSRRKLQHHSEEIKLSPKESDLLSELYKYRGNIMSRSSTLKKIWEEESYFTARSMDVYIAKLRKHLSRDPDIVIENIHGNGFQLVIK